MPVKGVVSSKDCIKKPGWLCGENCFNCIAKEKFEQHKAVLTQEDEYGDWTSDQQRVSAVTRLGCVIRFNIVSRCPFDREHFFSDHVIVSVNGELLRPKLCN